MSGIGHNSASKGGYIIITREMIDHPIVGAGQPMKPDDPSKGAYSKFEAWVDLLRQAAYKARKVLNKGREVTLERGDIMCANSFLAKRWNWSPKAVRNYLNRLQEWEMINGDWQKKGDLKPKYRGNQNKVLSICNYSYYQGAAREEGQPRGNQKGNQQGNQWATVTGCKTSKKCSRDELPRQPEGQPKGQQYNNQDNNQYNQYNFISNSSLRSELESSEKEISDPLIKVEAQGDKPKSPDKKKTKKRTKVNYTDDFEVFWNAYPTDPNMAKVKTFEQWEKLDEVDQSKALNSMPYFLNYCRQNPTYRPVHAERFISQRRFDGFLDNSKQHYEPQHQKRFFNKGGKSKIDQIAEARQKRGAL